MGTKQSRQEKQSPSEGDVSPSDDKECSMKKAEGITNIQILKHSSTPLPLKPPDVDNHPHEDVSMFPAPHPDHIPLHVYHEESLSEEEEFVDFCVKLMPHQHTLFCERRERVCEAVGKIQEGEVLEVDGLVDVTGGYWIRSSSAEKRSIYSYIEGTENCARYTLSADDTGRYIAFQYAQLVRKDLGITDESGCNAPRAVSVEGKAIELKRTINSLGPVLPGPPRMLDLRIDGEDFAVGSVVRACGQYIGGKEGLSEFWWFKIMHGKRIQLSEPLSILHNEPSGHDPREYYLREEDEGCVLKVKCRPIRSDGYRGEIFTSKASPVIVKPVVAEYAFENN